MTKKIFNRKTLFVSIISFVFFSQEINFLNGKESFILPKADELPYVPYNSDSTTFSGHSFDIFENSRQQNEDTLFYVQVFDNSTNDFNTAIENAYYSSNPILFAQILSGEDTTPTEIVDHFRPTLSNLNNDVYCFSFLSSKHLNSFYGVRYVGGSWTYGNSTNTDINELITYEAINDNNSDPLIYDWEEPVDNNFPYVNKYNIATNNDVFTINEMNDETLTFTIEVNNWTDDEDNLTSLEDNIGVTLINEDEEDPLLKYEQYEANLISNSSEYFTYQISGLSADTNYTFYSINYTGLTIDKYEYAPKTNIILDTDLDVPENDLKIYTTPFIETIDGNSLEIKEATSSSIEFTLHIVDTADKKFTNNLAANNNKMSVTLINLDNNKTIEKNASLVNINDSSRINLFTFKIDGLSKKTEYQLYSLNDTGLAIENINDYAIDDEILVSEELGVTNNTFITPGRKTLLISLISVILFLLLLIIIIFTIYFLKKKTKSQKKEKSTNK